MRLAILLLSLAIATAALIWAVTRGGSARRATAERTGRVEPTLSGKPAPPNAADEPLPPPGPPTIRGRVLARGNPVEGAYVYLIKEGDVCDEWVGTPANGSFALTEVGTLTLGASHPAYGPVQRAIEAKEGSDLEIDLELPESTVVEILVLDDATGAAVPGAQVLLLRAGLPGALEGGNGAIESMMDGLFDPEEFDFGLMSVIDIGDLMTMETSVQVLRVAAATADDSGRARLTGLPPGTFDAVVRHADYIALRLRGQPVNAEAPVPARLTRGGSLTVIAPQVDGRAAQGYRCAVVRAGFVPLPVGLALVDAAGRAHFAHLPPGDFKVVVGKSAESAVQNGLFSVAVREGADGEPPPPREAPIGSGTARIDAGRETLLDLSLRKGTTVKGRFLRGETPVSGMVVLTGGKGLKEQLAAKHADENGCFRFELLSPGAHRLSGMGDDTVTAVAHFQIKAEDEEVDVLLRLGTCLLHGRVLDAEGKPVQGAKVLVEEARRQASPARTLGDLLDVVRGHDQTGEDGEYRFDGLQPGAILLGNARRLERIDIQLRDGDSVQRDLRFDPGNLRRLTVRLRSPEGKPVLGQVIIGGPGGGVSEALAMSDDDEALLLGGGGGSESATFHLSPGPYTIHAQAEGFAPVHARPVSIDADLDMDLQLEPGVEVALTLVGAAGPLGGHALDVLNEDGARIGAGISLVAILLGNDPSVTGPDGVLRIPRVARGRYTVCHNGREVDGFTVEDERVERRIGLED